ncbi:hypothetical protein RZS08_62860, partial [Arthrospira platensis SPKY1]|nr:hypothetical protein [Arthrospira platensis SPKY1]
PRWRDDTVSLSVGRFFDVPVYSTINSPYDLVNTGGNFMSNGSGMGFSSELVIEENGPDNKYGQSNHDESGIDSIMFRFMGINEYVKLPVLPNDGIHHIDMHMKILNET